MIYIQQKEETKLPYHFDSACALYGAYETCQDYKLITFEMLQTGRYDILIKRNLFVGSVEFMQEVFRRVGLEDVRLPLNSNRPSQIMTLEEALDLSKSKEIFIKPYVIKQFPATILDGCNYRYLNDIPKYSKVFVYDTFDSPIESEWRLYVHNYKVVDIRHYSGDFRKTPYMSSTMDNLVMECKSNGFPSTFTIDVAMLKDYRMMVVEYNDFWAIGNYGISNDLYLEMLKTRYFDIMSQFKVE